MVKRLTIYEARLYAAGENEVAGSRKLSPDEARELAGGLPSEALEAHREEMAARRKFYTGQE